MLTLIAPRDGETVSLATERQEEFCTKESAEKRRLLDGALTFSWDALERTGGDYSAPRPVHVTWRFTQEADTPEDLRGGQFFLLVSAAEDLRDPIVIATAAEEADVWNLEIGRTYWFCVQREGRRSEVRRFTTRALAPRCILAEGVTNVRDIGGYMAGGKPIRQGLFYRGSEVDRHMHITEAGVRRLQQLGIRTDLDLRGEAVDTIEYPLLPLYGIRRVLLPVGPYEAPFSQEQKNEWRTIFQLLTKRENYPVYYHCWGGADRGGTLAFLVGALLGMSEEDLDFDYEYTNLSIWGLRSRNYEPYRRMKAQLKAYPGDTLAAQTAQFLKTHLDLTDDDIAAIREILL